jgi:formate C-acetyltransferase
MNIYTQNKQSRPRRLSEQTFKFAYESLNRKYGLDTLKTEAVILDDIENFDTLPPIKKYDLAITRIVQNAPIRICEGEKISGSATLGLAIKHLVPATYNGNAIYQSISHLTIDFESVLKYGINGIREKVEIAFDKYKGTEKEAFIVSLKNCLDAFDIWHKRYLDALKDLPEYKNNYENLKVVPNEPAKNFYQAVQSIWFVFAFVRLCGNWPGIGRIDYLLGDYLKKDLKVGVITIEEAREILAHFFIKGCEWINGQFIGSGDGQHYQNILLGGIDENGKDVTNEVTYLVLDVLDELGISDFPTSVRINKNTDDKLLTRVAEVMRFGGGILAVYNEDVVIDALVKDGYDLKEARKFANDGCWEVQIPGKTYFIYTPFDGLQILQKETLSNYDKGLNFSDFDALYHKYVQDLNKTVERICHGWMRSFKTQGDSNKDWTWVEQMPCTIVSLFEQGCIEKGLSYLEGGPIYNVVSPHIGGFADVVNSLYAIKKLVFEDKKLTFSAFMDVLKNNWENEEVREEVYKNINWSRN